MPFTPKRLGSVAYSLVMFVLVSVLAGVLVAGLFIPFAGMAGVTGRAAASELDNLPAELRTPTPATRSKVLMANGDLLARFFDENRLPVALDKIAPVMRQAQIAIEDHRFYEHGALDFKGTLRALVRNTTSDDVQGGSSITQQYVKMVQIQACTAKGDAECVRQAQETTLERKIRELRYAIALEKKFTKDEILTRYLNIAYYGKGAYGVEAAAQYYYGIKAAELNLSQAAMLAGLVQNPDTVNPVRSPSAALDRRDVVLNRMTELKLITPAEAQKAKKAGFNPKKVKPTRNGCPGTRYPFLCDYVYKSLLNTPSLGKTVEDRENMVRRGGLTIRTEIDPKSMDLAQKNVNKVVGPKDPVISTMNMIQPGTGLIVAMTQSRPVMGGNKKKGETWWNLSVEPEMGGIQGYQAGSTFKIFTLAAALEKGIPINKKFNARSPMEFGGRSFQSCKGREKVYGRYTVRNSVAGYSGVMDMTRASEGSVNTYFLQLELAAGMCRVTKMAQKMGVKVGHPIGQPPVDIVEKYQHFPSFTLGTVEVSPLSMAEAYATVAARGIHCNPIIISKITSRTGKKLEPLDADCKRVMDQDVADGVNKIFKSVVDKGTGKRAKVFGQGDIAGKTGTINSNEAVWFAGYTPEIAGVAMISIDNTRVPFKKGKQPRRGSGVKGYTVPSTDVYLQGSGSGDAGMKIWKPVMEQYLKKVPNTSFKAPPRKIEIGEQVTVPNLSGLGVSAAIRKLEDEGFNVETSYVYNDTEPFGAFIGWSPSSGQTVAKFGTVYLLRSRGKDPAVVAEERRRAEEEQRQAEQQREQREEEKKRKRDKPPRIVLPPGFPTPGPR
ncbi:MAG TPA: transglycosylase domain-containing protein [Propionibacteriaceae bacterium]|jgi:membrane peptidoglycan carboxypeptidase|nr:transglycosylase domain-containing protein [Propionibacteriaceae bacterium]